MFRYFKRGVATVGFRLGLATYYTAEDIRAAIERHGLRITASYDTPRSYVVFCEASAT